MGFQQVIIPTTFLNGLAKGYSKFERDKIYNLTGRQGYEPCYHRSELGVIPTCKQLPIFIESKSKDTLGHGMGQVLDSSAVISLLASLDKRFETMPLEESLAFFNRLLDASQEVPTYLERWKTLSTS